MICPVCKRPLKVVVKEQSDFVGGSVTLVALICKACPYKTLDILPNESHPPARLVFHVRSERDLNVIVARSSTATIRIPEIKASITPGTASPGFITTVEGVLRRFKMHLKSPEAEACIDRLLSGEPFTLIVEDPRGSSAINSLRVETEPL